jgi:hypothetical protein
LDIAPKCITKIRFPIGIVLAIARIMPFFCFVLARKLQLQELYHAARVFKKILMIDYRDMSNMIRCLGVIGIAE